MPTGCPEPIFTPARKAEMGHHDENVSFSTIADEVGHELAERIRAISIELYQTAAGYAATRGILIADTKFEFGLDDDDQIVLMDEVLTADSSRFSTSNGAVKPRSVVRSRVLSDGALPICARRRSTKSRVSAASSERSLSQ